MSSLPPGTPESGYVEPDLSGPNVGTGTLPPEEQQWHDERDAAIAADTEAVLAAEQEAADAIREERLDESGLRVSSLIPDWCSISGSEMVTLHVHGSGFTESTQIWWHDHLEPTVFVSENELTTGVTPWVFFNSDNVKVGVQDDGVDGDQQLIFRLLP